jgi:hypothetical protein
MGGGGLEKKREFFKLQFVTKKELQTTLTIKMTWIA